MDKERETIGTSLTDPYIPLGRRYAREQSDELAYGRSKSSWKSPLRDDFDIGIERIMRRRGEAKRYLYLSARVQGDGPRRRLMTCPTKRTDVDSPRLSQAHQTMMANLPKRKLADRLDFGGHHGARTLGPGQ